MSKTSTLYNFYAGTLLAVFSIPTENLIETFVLGCVGAIGSFLGALFIKWLSNKIKNLFSKKNAN